MCQKQPQQSIWNPSIAGSTCIHVGQIPHLPKILDSVFNVHILFFSFAILLRVRTTSSWFYTQSGLWTSILDCELRLLCNFALTIWGRFFYWVRHYVPTFCIIFILIYLGCRWFISHSSKKIVSTCRFYSLLNLGHVSYGFKKNYFDIQ